MGLRKTISPPLRRSCSRAFMKANYSRDNFSGNKVLLLEHFQKYCNHSVEEKEAAVLLGFGFVFALSQAAAGMLLRSASPKHQNSSLPNGYSIFSNALAAAP